MKTYIIYSKKQKNFIDSIDDISALVFVKYGFNWFYFADFLNVLYSIRRKFYVISAILILLYITMPENFAIQCYFTLTLGFLAYIFEGTLLQLRKYRVIATVEAKNMKQARELFLKEHILKNDDCQQNNSFRRHIFVKI